jgi:hypothetical protein
LCVSTKSTNFFYLPSAPKEDVDTNLLLDIPYAILSIPIISRLVASIKVNRIAPINGDATTIKDTTKDNIPTHIRNILDHLEI